MRRNSQHGTVSDHFSLALSLYLSFFFNRSAKRDAVAAVTPAEFAQCVLRFARDCDCGCCAIETIEMSAKTLVRFGINPLNC